MSVLYGALGGAVAGALGGAIGWGVTALIWADRDPADRPRWLSIVLVVLAVSLSRPVVHWLETPSLDQELTRAEREFPALAALKKADPSEYSNVRAAAEEAQSGTITEAEGMERVRAALMRAYQRKLPTAPDSLVQAQAQLVGAEYSALQGTPDICVNYIAGTAVVDLRQYLPPNMISSDQNLMAQVLSTPAGATLTVASDTEVQKAALPIILRIAHDEAIPPAQVAEAFQMKGEQRLVCRVYAALFQHISEMPTHQSAAVSRGLSHMAESAL